MLVITILENNKLFYFSYFTSTKVLWLCQHGFDFIKLHHHFNSPFEHAEDRSSSKEANVATKVGNEGHEGVSVELLIDLQCHYYYVEIRVWLSATLDYLHPSGQLNADGCRFGG